MKQCSKCKKYKPLSEFWRDSSKKDGLQCSCISCKRLFYQENRDKILIRERKHYLVVRDKRREDWKRWYQKNKAKRQEYSREWYWKNKDKINEKYNKYYKEIYYPKNKEGKIKQKNKLSYKKNMLNPKFRLQASIRQQIYFSLKSKKKGRHWEDLVGYTLNKLIQRLECQFKPGMSWNNYGKWHIHHKKPQALFNFASAEDKEFKNCWLLCNLQPLWATENISRGNKFNVLL